MERVLPWPARLLPDHVMALLGAFTLLALGFSLATWGRGAQQPPQPVGTALLLGLALHMAGHAVLGTFVSIGARRLDLAMLCALMTLAMDVDHLGPLLGWPVVQRASHSLAFLVVAPIVLGLLARWLRLPVPPRMAAVITFGGVTAHIAWDSLFAPGIPLWLPFATTIVNLPAIAALVLIVAAGLATAAVSHSAANSSTRG